MRELTSKEVLDQAKAIEAVEWHNFVLEDANRILDSVGITGEAAVVEMLGDWVYDDEGNSPYRCTGMDITTTEGVEWSTSNIETNIEDDAWDQSRVNYIRLLNKATLIEAAKPPELPFRKVFVEEAHA